MQKNNFFILTGAPGSGKTTLINQLQQKSYVCINEPAREIIAEQKAITGDGLYNKDKKLFLELMLSRALYQYKQCSNFDKPVIFDRGIPDLIAYAGLFGIESNSAVKASKIYQYNNKVFYLPSWQKIYTMDEDRTMSFEAASDFGNLIKHFYLELGYQIIDIPLTSIEERIKLIIDNLQ